MKKRIWIGVIIVLVSLILVIGAGTLGTSANEGTDPAAVTYTCHEIGAGETLWGYAERYARLTGMSMEGYIREVRRINGLEGDFLRTGGSLILPVVSE